VLWGVGIAKLDEGFDEFVVSRSPALLRTAVLLLGGDRHGAEDLLQTALLRLARHWGKAAGNPEPYVRRILVNLAIDSTRNRRRRVAETSWPEGLEPAVQDASSDDGLLEVLHDLPPQQRATVVLRFWDDCSVAQTAELLGCSEGTVKSNTSRALARLRDSLERNSHADR
jgi:RNA polymerase sigma-70 factor (sigma-E family)